MTKHSDILDNRSCHLEGQSIRIADKVSYLISDLEDGIRMGILTLEHLRRCGFFDRPPIDITPTRGESLYERFVSQRRSILKVIMEDILNATDQRLAQLKTLKRVREIRQYTVDYSPELKAETVEIWRKLQKGILHRDQKVIVAGMRSARIVKDLLCLYALKPMLVDDKFLRSHGKLEKSDYAKQYKQRVGSKITMPRTLVSPFFYEGVIGFDLKIQENELVIPTWDLVLSKDYVASLTDTRANLEHRTLFGVGRK